MLRKFRPASKCRQRNCHSSFLVLSQIFRKKRNKIDFNRIWLLTKHDVLDAQSHYPFILGCSRKVHFRLKYECRLIHPPGPNIEL